MGMAFPGTWDSLLVETEVATKAEQTPNSRSGQLPAFGACGSKGKIRDLLLH